MKIRDVLSPNDIIIDVRASDKMRLLRHLSAQAASELGLDPDEVSTLIAEREELGSSPASETAWRCPMHACRALRRRLHF